MPIPMSGMKRALLCRTKGDTLVHVLCAQPLYHLSCEKNLRRFLGLFKESSVNDLIKPHSTFF